MTQSSRTVTEQEKVLQARVEELEQVNAKLLDEVKWLDMQAAASLKVVLASQEIDAAPDEEELTGMDAV